ncbi:MAG: hypothetical protein EOM20_09600 [Spartobacteria bacterium]|nr:hypothetical protein [Spartobacteria bacterium]
MRFLKFFIGLALLPFCYIVTRVLIDLVTAMKPAQYSAIPPAFWGFSIGFLLWICLYFSMPRPMRTYVLAHELTHALWAWLLGAQVKQVTISKTGGSVTVSKTNFLIALAPYFFPFYTLCVLLIRYLVEIFYDQTIYTPFWMGLMGLTWAFHLTFTISMLKQHQPDIHAHGSLFSYSFIYLMNVLGICLWVTMIARPTLETLIDSIATHSQTTWTTLNKGLTKARERGAPAPH